MKTWGSGGIAPPFLTSALDGGEWSASRPCRFTPGTHWIGGWVSPRIGLDGEEKRIIEHCRESNPGRPARSYPFVLQGWDNVTVSLLTVLTISEFELLPTFHNIIILYKNYPHPVTLDVKPPAMHCHEFSSERLPLTPSLSPAFQKLQTGYPV
jgi:hypothetical protein